MDKALTIYDYQNRPVAITIANFENAVSAVLTVLSGDEVLSIHYNDESVREFDSCFTFRKKGYFDGEVAIPIHRLDELTHIHNSYDALEHFGDVDVHERVETEAFADLIELYATARL